MTMPAGDVVEADLAQASGRVAGVDLEVRALGLTDRALELFVILRVP